MWERWQRKKHFVSLFLAVLERRAHQLGAWIEEVAELLRQTTSSSENPELEPQLSLPSSVDLAIHKPSRSPTCWWGCNKVYVNGGRKLHYWLILLGWGVGMLSKRMLPCRMHKTQCDSVGLQCARLIFPVSQVKSPCFCRYSCSRIGFSQGPNTR